jgi:hypothetical protein
MVCFETTSLQQKRKEDEKEDPLVRDAFDIQRCTAEGLCDKNSVIILLHGTRRGKREISQTTGHLIHFSFSIIFSQRRVKDLIFERS